MKAIAKFICMIFSLLTILPVSAAGRYAPGTVTVNDYSSPGQTILIADYNVRYNPNARSQSFVGVDASSYLITFNGVDSSVNKTFYCTVTPSNSIFADAYHIAKNLRNGSSVLVYKNNTTSQCTSVQMSNYSYKTD
jgi:hypothetical protein